MRKQKIKSSDLLEMIQKDRLNHIGSRRQIYFSMPCPNDKILNCFRPNRRRCSACKTMIELNDIRVEVFNPTGNSYERTSNYHFRPCFAYILSKFVIELDDSIKTLVRFREKYDLPNK